MSFCTAINCMDGRVQLPVIRYLQDYFKVRYVDMITEPGPVRILAQPHDSEIIASIERRIDISVSKHHSQGIAVIAHEDCAGNPVSDEDQKKQISLAIEYLRKKYPQLTTIGLWVDISGRVSDEFSSF